MAAPAMSGGVLACRRARLLAAFALLAALSAAPAANPTNAAEDPKVWRALTEEDRPGRTPPAVPDGRGHSTAPASRNPVPAYVVTGIIVAAFAGIVVAVLASSRRPRQAPALPRPADPEPADLRGASRERIYVVGGNAGKRCPECGVVLRPGDKRCDFCGRKVDPEPAATPPAAAGQKRARWRFL